MSTAEAFFTGLDTALPTFFGTLLGCACDWSEQPRPMRTGHGGARAQLSMFGASSVGVDELVQTNVDVDTALAIAETRVGLRQVTIQVTVWTPSQQLAKSAPMFLERLRTRLRWSSSVATLAGLRLALMTVGQVVSLDPTENGRSSSSAALDFRFAYGIGETDAPAPFIETSRTTTALTNAGGELLPGSLQLDTNPEP